MEKVINQSILQYLEKHKLVNGRQYGFRSSTADLISYVNHLWQKYFDLHGESVVVALDICKAFDRVWHTDLLDKSIL